MLKKLTLLAVVAGFNFANIGAMGDQTPVLQPSVNDAVVTLNQNTKTILDTIKDESKFAGVAAVCYGITIAGAKYFWLESKRDYDHIVNSPFNCALLAAGLFVGNKLTNVVHEQMDDKRHKTAQLAGLGGAVCGHILFEALTHRIR